MFFTKTEENKNQVMKLSTFHELLFKIDKIARGFWSLGANDVTNNGTKCFSFNSSVCMHNTF